MDEKPAPKPAAKSPSDEQIAAALKEYEQANDRIACLAKYPWLVPILNAPKGK